MCYVDGMPLTERHSFYRPHPKDRGGVLFFSLFVSLHLDRGGGGGGIPISQVRTGVPHLSSGWGIPPPIPDQDRRGTPSQVRTEGGTPSQVSMGVCPSQVRMVGIPIPGQDGGDIPSQVRMGVPPPKSAVPGQDGGRGHTQLEQHSMYLLRGGRYASYVHAGGLSCLRLVSTF